MQLNVAFAPWLCFSNVHESNWNVERLYFHSITIIWIAKFFLSNFSCSYIRISSLLPHSLMYFDFQEKHQLHELNMDDFLSRGTLAFLMRPFFSSIFPKMYDVFRCSRNLCFTIKHWSYTFCILIILVTFIFINIQTFFELL